VEELKFQHSHESKVSLALCLAERQSSAAYEGGLVSLECCCKLNIIYTYAGLNSFDATEGTTGKLCENGSIHVCGDKLTRMSEGLSSTKIALICI
jgi:hypothetical protein